jgi:hypothetical protein
MNREELLHELGLSSVQLEDLLRKFRALLTSLDERQQTVVRRSLPTMAEALTALGTDVTPDDLQKLFRHDSNETPVMFYFALRRNSEE